MHPFLTIATSLLTLFSTPTLAASNDAWRSRSIYQVLTDRFARTDGSTTATCNTGDRDYCGGSFKGIQNHLDYIQGMGFDAVWISPITAQIEQDTTYGYAYHGYWQRDIYEINSHFGSAQDLRDLSDALHGRGMYLMVDIVVNHNAWDGAPNTIDYSTYNPFNDQKYFHPYCSINFNDLSNDTNIEECWLGDTNVPLPDLRTEDSFVASQYQSWIGQLVSDYSIDGLRLDTAMEVNMDFWAGFMSSAGVYMVGEVFQGDPSYVCDFQNYLPGVMNYPTYFPLISAFSSTATGKMTALANSINAVKDTCADTSLLGSFSENHDNPRFASQTQDLSLAKNLLTYTLLADGIPIVYEGQEQRYAALGGSENGGNDPYNREAIWFSKYNTDAPLYQLVRTLNRARKNAIQDDAGYLSYRNFPIYTDTTTIAVRKGEMVSVLSNKGAQGDGYTQVIPAGYGAGVEVTELLTCETVVADGEGDIVVPMAQGLPRIYYPSARLGGSGLCGS